MTNQEFLESITLEGEEWRDVIGWEGIYAISSFGRVASFQRMVVGSRRNCLRLNKARILSPRKSTTYNGGYYTVDLKKDGNIRKEYIHRLVALHFIPIADSSLKEVDHIDCDTLNNNVTNLRWVTHSLNLRKKNTVAKTSKSLLGNKNAPRKAVVCIGQAHTKVYTSMGETKQDGFHASAVYRCCNNLQTSYKGCKWMYLSDYEASNQ